ncbi:MAG: hypothetical protein JST49_04830 [Bacteroidetes bacterium]|nr:hypothetical protein [Bacteroidota bacterium]
MQAPTHILAGVIIKKLFDWSEYKAVAYTLIAVLAFLSHGLLDKFAVLTYHRPDADFSDPFWVGYHIAVLLVSIVFLYMYWGEYKLGIIFAMLPDFDWIMIHGQHALHIDIPFYNTPHLHNALNFLYDLIPGWENLMDLRYQPWAAIFEVLLIALLILIIRALDNRRRNIHF